MRLRLTNRISPLLSGGNGEGDVEHLRELLVESQSMLNVKWTKNWTASSLFQQKQFSHVATDPTHLGPSGMFSSKQAGMDNLSEEVDCPIPSTPQQKEARRLARLRQLRDMRARETMEARRERALKRRGEPSPTKQKPDSSAKRVSWREDGFLTKVMEY